MEETVASLSLAVHEKLELKKNRLTPLPGNDSGKRICVVTGVHGDELEGQYVVYLLNRRITESKALLTSTDFSLTQISEQMGFSSPAYFSQSFRRFTGQSPLEYRRKNQPGKK